MKCLGFVGDIDKTQLVMYIAKVLASLDKKTIYIDATTSKIYTYNGIKYETQVNSLPNATAEVAGAVKLYDQMGQNTDGTMTQKAITKELNEKFEMDVVEEEEMVIFDIDIG